MKRAAILVVLASCASESTEQLDDHDAKNVAMSIASTLRPLSGGGELGAMLDVASLVRGEMPAGHEDRDGTVFGQRGGFTYRYETACRDGHNGAVSCGSRTENADVDATWSSVLATNAFVSVASREGTWIINDITSERMRLDGDGHFEYASRATETNEGHAMSYDASYRNMLLVRGERWPRGGLVRYELALDATNEHAVTIRAEAQFHASGRATIVLPDHAFDLDLSTGMLKDAQ
ncbi:MAG: hypothetical protein M4D80_35695 [Myxococcota bacterium]|nr:hypothetical protein [Deltaproteobacteria bacterium]MDQ3340533.1 hypothetical protein [Myxococcota bacterium]